jgi:hypothetical protein
VAEQKGFEASLREHYIFGYILKSAIQLAPQVLHFIFSCLETRNAQFVALWEFPSTMDVARPVT